MKEVKRNDQYRGSCPHRRAFYGDGDFPLLRYKGNGGGDTAGWEALASHPFLFHFLFKRKGKIMLFILYFVGVFCLSFMIRQILKFIDLSKYLTKNVINNIMNYKNIIIASFIICAIISNIMLTIIIVMSFALMYYLWSKKLLRL